uniref:Lysozyme n=1 Tax=Rhabditophanes sp. KR3021 TaxID=114890 RepID=A0AC35U8P2_9BILA
MMVNMVIIKIIFITLCVISTALAATESKQTKAGEDSHQIEFKNECIKAMCIADSGCVQTGCSIDIHGRQGCGYFRMNVWQFKQCYQPGREIGEDSEVAWVRCAEDYDCASNCIKQVASRFRLKCYGKTPCELLARLHDGGANGCRTGTTLTYWSHVKEICPNCHNYL